MSRSIYERRKREIVPMVKRGMLDKEIASKLHLSYTTVKYYMRCFYREHGLYGHGSRIRLLAKIKKAHANTGAAGA